MARAGKTAGNITDDRQWLLLKGYLAIQDKNNDKDISSPKENTKADIPIIAKGPRKKNVDGDLIAPFVKCRRKRRKTHRTDPYQVHKPKSQLRPNHNYYGKQLNEKYNLDCYSDSELDSELDKGEEYHYEHGYETLI